MSRSLFNTSDDALGQLIAPDYEIPGYVPPWIAGSGGNSFGGYSGHYPTDDDGIGGNGHVQAPAASSIRPLAAVPPKPPSLSEPTSAGPMPAASTAPPATSGDFDTQTVLIGMGCVLAAIAIFTGGKRR